MQPGIDYIAFTKFIGKDTACLNELDCVGDLHGKDHFQFRTMERHNWKILYSRQTGCLDFKGSLPYHMFKHNLNHVQDQVLLSGIESIGRAVGLDLLDSFVTELEYGGTIEIQFNPELLFQTHVKMPGRKTLMFEHGRYFKGRGETLKLYDALKNMKVKVGSLKRKELILNSIINPKLFYLKVENHYTNPSRAIGKYDLRIADLCTCKILDKFRNSLISSYKAVIKERVFTTPMDIGPWNTLELCYSLLAERMAGPLDLENLFKTKLRQLPMMTSSNRKERMRQFRKTAKSFTGAESTDFNVEADLQKLLFPICIENGWENHTF